MVAIPAFRTYDSCGKMVKDESSTNRRPSKTNTRRDEHADDKGQVKMSRAIEVVIGKAPRASAESSAPRSTADTEARCVPINLCPATGRSMLAVACIRATIGGCSPHQIARRIVSH